jgi:hypothetical protein
VVIVLRVNGKNLTLNFVLPDPLWWEDLNSKRQRRLRVTQLFWISGAWLISKEMQMPNVKRVAEKQTAKFEQTDRKVAHKTGGKRDTSFIKAVGKISDLADQPPLIALGATTTILGLAAGNDRLARTGMRILASHWLATAAKSIVKHRIDRTRSISG